MYHKESGTGNDPFLVGNMLCRRWSLLPFRISDLINLPQLFLPVRETYHLDWRCTLSGKLPEYTLHSQVAVVSRYRAGCYGKSRRALMNPGRCQNAATRKPQTPLLLQCTSCVGKHRVSMNCDKRKLKENNSLFVLYKIAKHVVMTFFWNIFRECLNQRFRKIEVHNFLLSSLEEINIGKKEKNLHGKNNLIKVSKNLTRYRSENTFVGNQNNYVRISNMMSKKC